MRFSTKLAKTVLALVLIILIPIGITACGGTPEEDESAADRITHRVSFNGVSFKIDPDWDEDLDEEFGGVEPASNNKITVGTFSDGETKSIQTLEASENTGILGDPSDYEKDDSWTINAGTKVSAYTLVNDAGYVYSFAMGYNEDENTGFIIFFNRGTEDDLGELDDETYEAILQTISFNPTKVATSTADNDPATNSSSSDGSATPSQQNALETAQSYLAAMNFSHDGLVEQLEYEGYTEEDSIWAADHCGADWNAQALGSAKSYLDSMAFSYSGLIEQLEYDGYTTDQATYGADHCGADWNEQAVRCARSYLNTMSFSHSELVEQLEYEGFTPDQAEYGATQAGT